MEGERQNLVSLKMEFDPLLKGAIQCPSLNKDKKGTSKYFHTAVQAECNSAVMAAGISLTWTHSCLFTCSHGDTELIADSKHAQKALVNKQKIIGHVCCQHRAP